jgi:hypothetical protein
MSSSGSSSADDEITNDYAALLSSAAVATSPTLFGGDELKSDNQSCVDANVGVRDYLATVRATYLFQTLTNFTANEFELFYQRVCPVIVSTARSTCLPCASSGRPSKHASEQRLLSFVMYLKHENSVSFESALWNWSRTSANDNDDALFVASCLNVAASDEIRWPTAEERLHLATQISELPGCIGFIEGTLVQIRRPHGNPMHANWFNGRKKCTA